MNTNQTSADDAADLPPDTEESSFSLPHPSPEFTKGMAEPERQFAGELWYRLPFTLDGVEYHTPEQVLAKFRPAYSEDIEDSHAWALEIQIGRETLDREWDQFDADEREDILSLREGGYLEDLTPYYGRPIAPTRYEYAQAIKKRNPYAVVDIDVEEKRRAIIGLLVGEDEGCPAWVTGDEFETFNTLAWFDCYEECGCDVARQRGRGLFPPAIPNVIFGEGGTGKTELLARLHAEMIRAGLNTVHYEFEWDSGEEMIRRIAAFGISRAKLNRHLRVLVRPRDTPQLMTGDSSEGIDPSDVALVTLDSVTRAAENAWEMKADAPEVMDRILKTFIRPFTEYGTCAVLTDHVGQIVKNRPRGDKGKTDAIQGAVYRVEKVSDGHSRLVWFKDNSSLRPEGVKLEEVAAHMRIIKSEGKTVDVEFHADGKPLPRKAPIKREPTRLREGSTSDLILRFVTEFRGSAEIQGHMRSAHGTDRNTVNVNLGRLVEKGRLHKDETRGGYEPA
ncbi:AAA family ATPase [Streptomyces sp. NPDC020766]|uniref:AAA family ATPase n=1 Tax=Streptomyces sp. NPDC020766 TaxID=3155011 RepID=UPI0034052F75